jgi:hypothetical protein
MPAALVAGVAEPAGLAAVRALARAGIAVLALDHRRDALGMRSRHALAVRCPDPASDSGAYVEFLTKLAGGLGRRSPTLPASGAHARALAAGSDRLADRLLIPLPASDVIARLPAAPGERPGARRVAGYLSADGEALAIWPADEEAGGPAVEALREIGFSGLFEAAVQRHGDGTSSLAGVTPCFSDWHRLALRDGIDFARVVYWSLLGARPPVRAFDRRGGRAIRLSADPGPALTRGAGLVRRLRG